LAITKIVFKEVGNWDVKSDLDVVRGYKELEKVTMTMYTFSKSATQYGFSALSSSNNRHLDNNRDTEYIYADDPKDGNDSSAEEEKEKEEADSNLGQRLSKSAAPSMTYLRAQARRQSEDKTAEHFDDSDDDEGDTDSCVSLPWNVVPNNVIEDLGFFKNAGKYDLSMVT